MGTVCLDGVYISCSAATALFTVIEFSNLGIFSVFATKKRNWGSRSGLEGFLDAPRLVGQGNRLCILEGCTWPFERSPDALNY